LFLKRIEIKGFKSFADKVELELGQGITGVVGPNGSGKSNISDAVRWVLGEQSAKSLRGLKMEDVIFAGTDTRKPLGFAEVSITFDNSDNVLPTEYTEVTVTRRMYRSGESEYLINKIGCRLKDITELFMDTGIGKDGYSIIGQGRIDEILNAKPEDRREIFEEAAGIVKYKTRKQESEKKLGSTEQNITRIDDIINELETQIAPLEEQSAKAKKYLNLREELKALELNLFIRNVDKIKDKITAINEGSGNLENELLDINRKNARIDENYTDAKTKLKNADEEIEHAQEEVSLTNSESERVQGEINVLNEKVINIEKDIARLNEDTVKEKLSIDELSNQKDENKRCLENYKEILNGQTSVLDDKSAELEKLNSSINEKEQYIEGMKSEVIEILNTIADKKGSINSYNTFKTGIERRITQINTEKSEKELKKTELQKNMAEAQKTIDTFNKTVHTLDDEIKKYEIEKQHTIEKNRIIEKDIFETSGKIQAKQGRYRVLHEMENEFEGYNRSVKEIMKLKLEGKSLSSGICGVIAELIHVPQNLEIAIEVALGGALQNIVTEDEYIAKQCIEYLKSTKSGRATFLPLTTIKGRDKYIDVRKIAQTKGFIGFADKLVSFDSKYSNIISSLLSRVIVTETIDDAIVFAKKTDYSMKVVTLDGDIINPGGAFTGGSINSKTGKILSRKREIEELEKDLKELKDTLSTMEADKRDVEKKYVDVELMLKKLGEERHSADITLSSYNNNYNVLQGEINKINTSFQNLQAELFQLNEECSEADKKVEEELREMSDLEARNAEVSKQTQDEQSGIKDTLICKENLINEITGLKVKSAELKQSVSAYETKITEILSSIEKSNCIINQKAAEMEALSVEKDNVNLKIGNLKLSLEKLSHKNTEIKSKLESLYADRKKFTLIIEEIEQKKKEYGESCALLQDEIHKLEMQKTRLDMELESLQSRIWEDYEISYAAALKYKKEIDNLTQAAKDINAIKESIKELGTVNVAAIEEFKKVKERYEFLIKQKSDLEEAKDTLNKVIAEMTGKMEKQFAANFEIINNNFNSYFQQLFGGGRAELVLCDDIDVLSSGIEIIAQPPGKKLQSLTLLSGGEKALTAIALLFAILKMKPSPFCILDEIEAALDDINIVRFSRFLKELSRKTQFIVVTHRKGTMEITDSLYGVTMEEKGVSRLVSARLSEKAS
jgi:chromosome segregation protein SMC, common bacterial type